MKWSTDLRALSDEGITGKNRATNLDNKNQIFEKHKLLSAAYFKIGRLRIFDKCIIETPFGSDLEKGMVRLITRVPILRTG